MTPIYVTATGQTDNLGDSLLRRGYLNALRRAGELHVNLDGSTDDYIAGLGVVAEDRVYRSARSWERSLAVAALSGRRPTLALNAGEARVTPDHAYVGARLEALGSLVRISGGKLVQAGLGIREAPRVQPKQQLLRTLTRAAVVTWRDEPSALSVGIGSVQPDWAFELEPLATPAAVGARSQLVVTMRGDRPVPGQEWIRLVKKVTTDYQLGVVLASQVRRDNTRLHEIGALLDSGATVMEWPDGEDHGQRLQVMAEIYSRARVVVSDRLHALILGAMHGAVPLGLTTHSAEKLRRTLAPARLDDWALSPDDIQTTDRVEIPTAEEVLDRASEARSRTHQVAAVIAAGRPAIGTSGG